MSDPHISESPTTADIAAQTLDTLESHDTSAVAAETPTETPETVSEEEQILREHGYKHATKPDGREHWIRRSKVLEMIGSGLKKKGEAWTSEKATIEKQRQEYADALAEYRSLIAGDPKAFLSSLAGFDPRYRSFLEPPQAAPPPPQAPEEPMPQPDIDLGNGQRTYSLDGLQKLLEWNTKRTMSQAESKFNERLKPWEERDKQEQERANAQRLEQAKQQRYAEMMAEAQTWPLFGKLADDDQLTPFQQEVLDILQKDPTISFHSAYMKAAGPKLSSRESLIEEMNKIAGRPAPTVTRAGGETRKPGALTTAEIAARVDARLNKG